MQINFELSAHDFGFKWLKFPTKEYSMYFAILVSLNILRLQIYKLYFFLNILNVIRVIIIPIKTIFFAVIISLILYVNIVLISLNLYSMKILMEEKTIYSVDFSLITLVLTILIISLNMVYFSFYRCYLVLLNGHGALIALLLYFVTPFKNFFQKVIHFLIFFLILYVFFNLTLITTH